MLGNKFPISASELDNNVMWQSVRNTSRPGPPPFSMIDRYDRVARVYPAILSSLPLLLLNYFLLRLHLGPLLDDFAKAKWPGGIAITVVAMYLLAQAARIVGKELFEDTVFENETRMPTTELLLHGNSGLSAEHRAQIHVRLAHDFDLHPFGPDRERLDELGARRILVDCVRQMRRKVGNGRLLLKHNSEYGFIRNLAGGALLASVISLVDLALFGSVWPNTLAYSLSLALAVSYVIVMASARPLMRRLGHRYALVLMQEYLGT